jgi:hypothetical protein
MKQTHRKCHAALGIVLAPWLLSACQSTPEPPKADPAATSSAAPRAAQTVTTNVAPTTPTPATPSPSMTATASDRVEVDVAGNKLSFTIKDGEAMKASLLKAIEQSNVEHKAELLQGTKHVAVSIDAGYLRIGIWILQAKGNDLVWRYRMHAGSQTQLSYLATVVKQSNDWVVRDVRPELGHRRPR